MLLARLNQTAATEVGFNDYYMSETQYYCMSYDEDLLPPEHLYLMQNKKKDYCVNLLLRLYKYNMTSISSSEIMRLHKNKSGQP